MCLVLTSVKTLMTMTYLPDPEPFHQRLTLSGSEGKSKPGGKKYAHTQ